MKVEGLHRVSMRDLLGTSRLRRGLEKIRKPSLQRLGKQMAPARETGRRNCLREQEGQDGLGERIVWQEKGQRNQRKAR